jgi:hypothetical protein
MYIDLCIPSEVQQVQSVLPALLNNKYCTVYSMYLCILCEVQYSIGILPAILNNKYSMYLGLCIPSELQYLGLCIPSEVQYCRYSQYSCTPQ